MVWRATPTYFDRLRASRGGQSFVAVGRLAHNVPMEEAQAELDGAMTDLSREYPEANTGRGMRLARLKDLIVAPVRPIVLLLAGAVGFVLIIACSNVASLLLSRGASRQNEMAVRTALGASRGDLVRQLLIESIVIASAAAALGIGLAALGVRMVVVLGGESIPRSHLIGLDLPVVAFTATVALVTGLAFGLAPARRATGSMTGLRAGRGVASPREIQRLHSAITGVEIALAMMLLTGAGMLIRSYWNLTRVDPGLAIDGALTFQLSPSAARYPGSQDILRVYDGLLAAFAVIPGVEATGAVHILPMSGGFSCDGVARDDLPPPAPGEDRCAEARVVTPDYFRASGIALRSGRGFTASDDSVGVPVAVVNARFAQALFGEESAVGARVTIHGVSREIVGVVGNVRLFGPSETLREAIYLPHGQDPRASMYAVVRVTGDPGLAASAIRARVQAVDPTMPISEMRTLDQVLNGVLSRPRFHTVLLGVFAISAVVLAAVGIAAMMAYAVTHRFREIGVRMALGARGGDIVQLIAGYGARVALAGVVAGALGAAAGSRLLAHLLFEVSPLDGLSLVAAGLIILVVAASAAAIPSRKAATANVSALLRYGRNG